jgi:hypothetical protein
VPPASLDFARDVLSLPKDGHTEDTEEIREWVAVETAETAEFRYFLLCDLCGLGV